MENTMKPTTTPVTHPVTGGYVSASSHALVPSLRGRTSGFGAVATDAIEDIDTRDSRAWSPPT